MTHDEAIKVVVDVATKRNPHNRHELAEAVAILEPSRPTTIPDKQESEDVKSD